MITPVQTETDTDTWITIALTNPAVTYRLLGLPEKIEEREYLVYERVTVDGIVYGRGDGTQITDHQSAMFRLKDDGTDEWDSPFIWHNRPVSERHWLSCGTTTPIGGMCYVCERIADEDPD